MKSSVTRKQQTAPPFQERLIDPQLASWLAEPIFVLGDVKYSREQIVKLSNTPCTRAAQKLSRVLAQFNIPNSFKLFHIGMPALQRCPGIGRRACLMAAYILYEAGYDVNVWMDRKNKGQSWDARVVEVQKRTRRQKHA